MKLNEMRILASETLKQFIQEMPDVPFTEDDIIFSFAKKSELISRALELCKQYCPEKTLNESQLRNLSEEVAANALIGREKSAVLIRIDHKVKKQDFRRIIWHELMHIFCAKLEMGDEHFIDIYGSGTTPEVAPEDAAYDGMVVAGYKVWSEFIAQYYAVKMVDEEISTFSEIAGYVLHLIHEVTVDNMEGSKGAFSMICAYWFNCTDFDEDLDILSKPDTFIPSEKQYGEKTQKALYDCLNYIYKQMQNDIPWKISEQFIHELGLRFATFRLMNSMYIG